MAALYFCVKEHSVIWKIILDIRTCGRLQYWNYYINLPCVDLNRGGFEMSTIEAVMKELYVGTGIS